MRKNKIDWRKYEHAAGDPLEQAVRLTLRPLSLNCVIYMGGVGGRDLKTLDWAVGICLQHLLQKTVFSSFGNSVNVSTAQFAGCFVLLSKMEEDKTETNEGCCSCSGGNGLASNLIARSPPTTPLTTQFKPL